MLLQQKFIFIKVNQTENENNKFYFTICDSISSSTHVKRVIIECYHCLFLLSASCQ